MLRTRKRPKKVKPTLTPEQLAEYQAKVERTGVVYLSRIPPFMKPQKLRQLLSKHGEIDRIYLAPEGAHSTRARATKLMATLTPSARLCSCARQMPRCGRAASATAETARTTLPRAGSSSRTSMSPSGRPPS